MSSHRSTAVGLSVALLHWSCMKEAYSGTTITYDCQHDSVTQGSHLTDQLAILPKVFWHKRSWDITSAIGAVTLSFYILQFVISN